VNGGFLGVLSFELHFHEGGSLKEKRHHLRHVKAQLERRLGASVAEVEYHELWQRAGLALTLVRRDASDVTRALDEARRYLSAQEYELVRAESRLLSIEEVVE
jgi:uncharacterized protein YlxP (DUF503 family)